ncbi:NADH dehydrogenase subunit 5 (mitochondrion) [Rhodnius prolixus]|uniref:NADH-ubiquinone oxidoreductase chain 5 n=1 Tax=Rhodnius prolixus TaxID=13249 RepID=A0A7D7FB39_RHOPR|nr:NADH dehydrogenase subunit 5 [Rhodnius prolixus]QMP96827.1 NADH dehydrogenase subunit 5 [Rhodnius prolixus]
MLNKVSVYFLGSLFLFMMSILLFFLGCFFLINDYVLFLDWEFLSFVSCNMTMTFLFDWMSLVFVSCVFLISSMVIYYSESYMISDKSSVRFYFLVFLFVMSMMMMVVSPNLISILIGWDGLGLVSYCLVIYFQNFKSYSAGMLTILANRVGDVAILLSISWMLNYGSWHYIYYVGMWDYWGIYLVSLVVLAGFTKSAQIPFSSWLPAAMAAPTPVSSLVHSSTLVTAGVYLLIRFSDLLLNVNCLFVLGLSLMTMTMAGLSANVEYDLKKVIALSTLSQLGLMMSILFLGFPILAFLHLLTHAFFKALLFMCAGVMIHCMSDSQDMRYMGGIINNLPFTCACFCISNLSLCGFPFMAGFYSKDIIIEMMTSSMGNFFIYLFFFISVGTTVSYTFRSVNFCLFSGLNMYSCQVYSEDSIMMKSMVVLSLLAIFSGSMLCWLVFSVPCLVFFPFHMKIMPLIFILLGAWIGFKLSSRGKLMLGLIFGFFMSSMWFLTFLSTSMVYGNFLYLSNNYISMMDYGWGEFLISKSPLMVSSLFSRVASFYQYNNVKIFMLIYLLMIVFFII